MPLFYEIFTGAGGRTMRVHLDDSGGNFVDVDVSGAQSYLTGQERQDPAKVSAVMSTVLQMAVDQRIPLTDFPPDDPDRTVDPAHPWEFHGHIVPEDQIGQGQNAIDVYRPNVLVGGTATHMILRRVLINVTGTSFDDLSIDQRVPSDHGDPPGDPGDFR